LWIHTFILLPYLKSLTIVVYFLFTSWSICTNPISRITFNCSTLSYMCTSANITIRKWKSICTI
jgi:hypothetical protein